MILRYTKLLTEWITKGLFAIKIIKFKFLLWSIIKLLVNILGNHLMNVSVKYYTNDNETPSRLQISCFRNEAKP